MMELIVVMLILFQGIGINCAAFVALLQRHFDVCYFVLTRVI